MNKIKLLLVSLLVVIFAVCAFAACGKQGGGSDIGSETTSESGGESESAKTEYKDGEYTLLDFESPSDLYKIRPYISDILDMYGSISVEKDPEHAASGSGTLKYGYISGKTPSIVFYPAHSDCPDIPIEKLLSFGISIYSGAQKAQKVTLSVVSGKEPVYEETRELKVGRNDYVFDLDPVLVKFRSGEIKAFCVGFETGASCDYYLDKWTATIGEKQLNDVQKTAMSFAETVDKLKVSAPDAETLLTAYGYYGKLDAACRSAVKDYYDEYNKAVKKFIDTESWRQDAKNSGLAFFSEKYGVLQPEETDGVSFEYVADAFGSGKSGTTFTFGEFKNGKENEKLEAKYTVGFLTSTIVVDNYDYVAFTIKNDSDKTLNFRFNGSANAVYLTAGESREIELPATDLVESGNSMTFAFEYEAEQTEPAKVSVSTLYARTVSREKIYVSALTGGKYSVDGNVEKTEKNGKFTFAFGNAEGKIVPEKAFGDINVSQNVSFSVAADKNVNFFVYGASGEVLGNCDVSATASVIYLSENEYEKLAYITVSEKCTVTLSEMILARAVDNDYTEIALKNDYVVKASEITTDNAREAIYFISSFESMVLYKQNYMKEDLADVYADIAARADKVSEVFKSTVKKVVSGEANDVEGMLVLDLSGTYSLLKSVVPLTKQELDQIDSAKKTTLLKYKYTVFDFDNPMAVSNFGKQTKWWDWSGNLTVENFDGGKKLAINVQRVMPDGDRNARRIYITYDLSSVSSTLNGYDYVSWRIYNANSGDKTIFFITYGWGGTVYSCTLRAGQWTDIRLTVTDFKNAGQFVIYPADPGEKFYIDNVYACSVEYVQAAVDKIPAAKDITASDRETVNFARTEYEKLSAFAKKKIDISKLTAAEAKLAALPLTLFDMSKEGILESFTHPADVGAYLWNGDFSIENDAKYGKVLSVNTTGTYGTQPVVYLGYLLKENLSAYDYVTFNVYNPKAVNITFAVITMGWGKSYYTTRLAANGWTEIVLPASSFVKAGYFYFADVLANETLSFRITDIVAYGAGSVQGMINELPDADNVTRDDTEIVAAARKHYNLLSDGAKAKVDITRLTACEGVLANLPYTVFDMSSPDILDKFTHPTNIAAYLWDGEFSVRTDETYGKVLVIHTTGSTGGQPVLYFGYNLSGIDLSNYSEVTFSVYNPKNSRLDFALITTGWGACHYKTKLNASGWTEITVSVENFKKAGFIYIANVEKNEELTFLVTNFVAHN